MFEFERNYVPEFLWKGNRRRPYWITTRGLVLTIFVSGFYFLQPWVISILGLPSLDSREYLLSTSIFTSTLLTFSLIAVYRDMGETQKAQKDTLENQEKLLEEQHKISKFRQTPYLVGPYNLEFLKSSAKLVMKFSNTGEGIVRSPYLSVEFEIPPTADCNIEIENTKIGLSRADSNFLEPDIVYPKETNVLFRTAMGNISIKVKNKSKSCAEVEKYAVQDFLDYLAEIGVGIVTVVYKVHYRDVFGSSEDPFGREYIVEFPKLSFNPSRVNYTEHLESMH